MYWEKNGDQDLLILKPGQKVLETITSWAREHKVGGVSLSGIGAVKDVELGYYDLEKRDYIRKSFSGADYELISFLGNTSDKAGDYYTHAHVSLGGPDFAVFGGHLFEATCAVTVEIFGRRLGRLPRRQRDESVGLDVICGVV